MLGKPRLIRAHRLCHFEHLIDGNVEKSLFDAARPTHFHEMDGGSGRAKAEVGELLALRQVVTTAADLAVLHGRTITRHNCHHRTNAVAVRVSAAWLDPQPVIAVGQIVAIENRGTRVVDDKKIEVTILVVIKNQQPLSGSSIGDAHGGGDISESPAVVAPQFRGVGVEWCFAFPPVGLEAVGHRQIEIAVVVVIEKRRTPSPTAITHAGDIRGVFENAIPTVSIESVTAHAPSENRHLRSTGFVDRGEEQIRQSVAVVVAHRQTHAVFFTPDPRLLCAIGKRSVAVIPKKTTGPEIAGNHQIWPTIEIEVG